MHHLFYAAEGLPMGFARFFGYLTALYYLQKTEMALLPTFRGFAMAGSFSTKLHSEN